MTTPVCDTSYLDSPLPSLTSPEQGKHVPSRSAFWLSLKAHFSCPVTSVDFCISAAAEMEPQIRRGAEHPTTKHTGRGGAEERGQLLRAPDALAENQDWVPAHT